MSTTVDERIVEMRFDNRQFEQNVQTSINTLDKLKQGLNLADSAKGLDAVGKAASGINLGPLTSAVETVHNRFSALQVMGITALSNITNSAVNAGKRIASALTIDPVKTGYNEYELKMGSIQTIMAGTGESLETVNKYLNELNEYSDRTIYSFSDMTSNIGKFTNAGVKLEDAVAAIQGVSNVAAVSGANAGEASRAMYNFAQALSAGYVKLIDWKSIENANMATVEFKNYLLEAAAAEGTLTKTSDGMYKTLKGNVLDATHNFNDTLQDQWMTTDALVNTLKSYADETTEIGKKAFASAQDVKTFTQLFDTLKESAQSGWAATWETIVGDFEEAKVLLTDINNVVSGFIGASAEARNSMLSGWKDLGGRTKLIEALTNAFHGAVEVLTPIQEAFREIFPQTTAAQLYEITEQFVALTEKFRLSETTTENLKTTFKGLFAILSIGKQLFFALASAVADVIGYILPVGDGFFSLTASVGEWWIAADEAVKKSGIFTGAFETIGKVVKPVAESVKAAIELMVAAVKAFFGSTGDLDEVGDSLEARFQPFKTLGEFIAGVFQSLTNVLKGVLPSIVGFASRVGTELGNIFASVTGGDFSGALDLFNTGVFATVLLGLKKFMDSLSSITGGAGGAMGGVSAILDGVKGSLEAWQGSIKSGTLLKIAGAIGILAVSLVALSMIDSAKLTGALAAITVLFIELFGSMTAFEKLSGGGFKSMTKVAVTMVIMSTAVLILSAAVSKLANQEWDGLVRGLVGVAGLSAILVAAAKSLSSSSGKMIKGGLGLIAFGVAIRILVGAVERLGDLDTGNLVKGLAGIGALLGEIAIFSRLGSGKGMVSMGAGMILIGTSMLIFGQAVQMMGGLSLPEIGKGLLTMAGSLTAVVLALNLMPGNVVGKAAGLVGVAAAMVILSNALGSMGKMTWDEIGRSLVVLAGSLAVLTLAVNGMTGALAGAAAMLVVSAALAILAPVLKSLGEMSLIEIGTALLAMAGTFAVLGLAAAVLAPVVPTLLALAGAVALFGVAALAVGAGILAFSTGLSALAVAGTAGVAALVMMVTGLIGLIPMVLQQIGMGVVAFARVIADGAPAIAEAVVAVAMAIITTIGTVAPELVTTVADLIILLLETLAKKVPEMVKAGFEIIMGFLTGVRDNIGKVAAVGIEIVTNFITAVGGEIPKVVDAGFEMIIEFIDGLGDAIRENTPRLIEAVVGLGGDIVNGLADGIFGGIASVGEAIGDLGETAINGLKDLLNINSPSKVFNELGQYTAKGFADGISGYQDVAVKASENLGTSVVNGLKTRLKINSPSKVTRDEVGRYVVQGIAEGITADTSAEDAATKKAQNIVSVFKTELDKLDLDTKTSDLEYELWEKQYGDNASDAAKSGAEITMLSEKLRLQAEKVQLAQSEYQTTLDQLGATSEQAQEAYNKLLQQQISLAELSQQVNEARNTASERNTNAMVAYAQWIAESKEDLLKLGFSMEQIQAAARERTGYNLDAMGTAMTADVSTAVTTAMNTVQTTYAANAENTMGSLVSNFNEFGVRYAGAVGSGLQNGTPQVQESGTAMVNACSNSIRNGQNQWIQGGAYLVDGFVQGIRANIERAAQAAADMATAAYRAAMAAISVASPSKKFAELGMYADLGFANGLEAYADKAANASADMATGALGGLVSVANEMTDAINSQINAQPTIRPVLDLSELKQGGRQIGGILGSSGLSISTSIDNARIVSSVSSGQRVAESAAAIQPVRQEYQFVQNNYSPKALSRLDIYRQTKNQFSALKGMVNGR